MAGLAALGGQDPCGGVEAGHVVGLGELAHEHHRAPVLGRRHRVSRREHDAAPRGARRGPHPPGEHVVFGVGGERGVQQRFEPCGVDRQEGAVPAQEPLRVSVHREPRGGLRRTLGAARLEHVQATLLHGELGVLHVLVVALERVAARP